ncbi:Ti-type conjugative transfer relaxase TraA [Marinivivus vitaminiproducens]|uniref:Ti-type conjugative transfer relaxase TraA n=1 Tax=Marinivivus vitaminiproducens TaxID=3035935 RepID=UPI0027AA9E86|nr:Ti-type conjugative transfer relaxase TraA [Geminicoccaceae bacterium SCSIO 64248]
MAQFHSTVKTIGRAQGRSSVAAAAYRSGAKLHDERTDLIHDYSRKQDVVHSEILLPEGANEAWRDREVLWNAVEASETRKNSRTAREIEFALPRELSDADNIALARELVEEQCVKRGMVADLNVHVAKGSDGGRNPHAHVMLTTRTVQNGSFDKKEREWNHSSVNLEWREVLAVKTNQKLAERGHDKRVDHRSYEERGIKIEPQTKIGWVAQKIEARGETSDRRAEHNERAARNGQTIGDNPAIALSLLTQQQATFTRADLARLVNRQTDDAEQFQTVMAKVEASPELVRLGEDKRGVERFSTREQIGREQAIVDAGRSLSARQDHRVTPRAFEQATKGVSLSEDQREALEHVTKSRGLSLVEGFAGTGKSTMLRAGREAWEASGHRVRGSALSGVASRNLAESTGMEGRTLDSWRHAWERGRDRLSERDVFVLDEAAMVDTRRMERLMREVEQAGAKLVAVGDVQQFQAISAGSPFRMLTERHGSVEMTQVQRQRDDWQREAVKELATGKIAAALKRFENAGMVHAAPNRTAASVDVLKRWNHDRKEAPERSSIMYSYTRRDTADLNEDARATMREEGALQGEDRTIETRQGSKPFAVGDRIVFLENSRELGVQNGTTGTLRGIAASRLTVQLDSPNGPGSGRKVAFERRQYDHIDHGYAITMHKAQSVTVDRSFMLATPHMDRHAAYVAMSRHRAGTDLVYSTNDVESLDAMADRLSRDRSKDNALDYGERGEPQKAGLFDRIIKTVRATPKPEAGSDDPARDRPRPDDATQQRADQARSDGRIDAAFTRADKILGDEATNLFTRIMGAVRVAFGTVSGLLSEPERASAQQHNHRRQAEARSSQRVAQAADRKEKDAGRDRRDALDAARDRAGMRNAREAAARIAREEARDRDRGGGIER